MPEKGFEEKEEIEEDNSWKKKLNKFLNNYFNWIIVVVVLIVFVSGFFFLIMPKYAQTAKNISTANEQEKVDFQAKTNELAKVKQLISSYKSIDKKYVDKVSAIAPIIQNKEELFSEINYLVSKNQLLLESMSLGEVSDYRDEKASRGSTVVNKTIENIQVVSIDLSVRGTDYQAFKNFLSTLENNLHLMDVTSINFDPGGQTTFLTIDTYYTKQ